jgi:hypothetical protein
LAEEALIKYFANGVQHEKAAVPYAVQQPTAAAPFVLVLRFPALADLLIQHLIITTNYRTPARRNGSLRLR